MIDELIQSIDAYRKKKMGVSCLGKLARVSGCSANASSDPNIQARTVEKLEAFTRKLPPSNTVAASESC